MVRQNRRAAASLTVDAPLGPVIALSVLLSLGAVFVMAPLLWSVLPVTPLPAPFPSHHQDAETLIFLLTFAVVMPLGVVTAGRVSGAIVPGPNAHSFSAVVGVLAIALELVVVLTRVAAERSGGGGPGTLALGAGLWWLVAALSLWRSATSSAGWPALERHTTTVWVVAAVLVAPVALSFAHLGSLSWTVLGVGVALTVAVVLVRERASVPTLWGPRGRAVDLGLILLLLLAVPNLFVVAAGDPATALDTQVIQFHQNFYLGPANQLLHGDAMLVDVLSQYGVGSIYVLAAAFQVIPIGNGTLGLVEGGLSALMFLGTFLTLRVAGVSRAVAATTLAVAVTALVFGLQHPLGALLQHGAFRFGLPIGVVLFAAVEARWDRVARPARALQLLTVAVASVWALEGFAYTVLTALVVALVGAVTLPRGRRRALATSVGLLVAAVVVGHLVFAAGTLAYAGELPDWGWYINTLREFLLGDLGNWTYDFTSFSPGLALGATYLASGSALVLLVRRRRDLHDAERTTLIAIAGMTAYGIALFSYVVNRSADHIIPYVSLPAIALGALWLTLVERPSLGVPRLGRRAGLAIALALSTLLVGVAWPSAEEHYPQSALAHVIPGGPSLPSALRVLGNPAPLRAQAPEGVALLEEHLPGEDRSIVLTSADLAVEILVRAERGSAVPLGDPWEDSFVPSHHLDPLGAYVAGLGGGERMLLDGPARTAFDAYRADPTLDPLATGGDTAIVPAELASLQEWVLRELSLRFDLRTIVRTGSGLEVVELVPR